MNASITFLLGLFVAFLVWLVVTKKVALPILFEAGLSAIAFGMVLWALSMFENQPPNTAGSWCVLIGALMLAISTRRQRMKRLRALRDAEPYVIDGGRFRRQ